MFECSGRTDTVDRERNITGFKSYKGKAVFLASPRVAGKSLTLVESSYSYYYSNGYSLEQRLQSEDRNHRIGQKNNVTYFDSICLGTPDVKVQAALRDKKIIAGMVLSQLVSFFTTLS